MIDRERPGREDKLCVGIRRVGPLDIDRVEADVIDRVVSQKADESAVKPLTVTVRKPSWVSVRETVAQTVENVVRVGGCRALRVSRVCRTNHPLVTVVEDLALSACWADRHHGCGVVANKRKPGVPVPLCRRERAVGVARGNLLRALK